MLLNRRLIAVLTLIALCACSFLNTSAGVALAQKKDKKDKTEKTKKQKDEKKNDSASSTGDAHPVLWEDPTDIESRDLFNGPGGAEGAPDPNGKFTFVDRSKKGTSEKIHVTDDKGRKWTVKFGPEAKPETSTR